MTFSCVERGRIQGIIIRSAPGLQLSMATSWPDGAAHQEWGATTIAVIPPNGTYTQSWAIPVNAPKGTARTDVLVAGKINGEHATAFAHPTWRISSNC